MRHLAIGSKGHSTINTAGQPLAVLGGPPAVPGGAPRWPAADPDVLAALEQAYADGSWGRYHGPHGKRLARALAELHQVEFVTLCCSGTFAVELALRGLRVSAGDEVILAGYDFPGNFRAIEAVGARPVLVDVASDNWNLDPRQLAGFCGARTRAIVASHLHGGLVPMRELADLAAEQGLAVVEDACQAPGAEVQGRLAGTWGDVGVLSFGGSKLLTAGRGGAILTRQAGIHQRAKIYCEQGNNAFPLSELQAAVLLPQLAKLDQRNLRRRAGVERLWRLLERMFAGEGDAPAEPMPAAPAARQAARGGEAAVSAHPPPKPFRPIPGLRPLVNRAAPCAPAYYKLGLKYVAEELAGRARDEFAAAVQAEGVALEAGFRGFARRSGRRCRPANSLPHSRHAAEACVVLHHPVLLEPYDVIDQAGRALAKVIRAFTDSGAPGPPASARPSSPPTWER